MSAIVAKDEAQSICLSGVVMSEEFEDRYGNPLEDGEIKDGRLIYCCFPDCGCDGARLCMAESGASHCALALNIEKHPKPFAARPFLGKMKTGGW